MAVTQKEKPKDMDDVLRRLLNTPPDHKPRTKSGVPKKKSKEKRA